MWRVLLGAFAAVLGPSSPPPGGNTFLFKRKPGNSQVKLWLWSLGLWTPRETCGGICTNVIFKTLSPTKATRVPCRIKCLYRGESPCFLGVEKACEGDHQSSRQEFGSERKKEQAGLQCIPERRWGDACFSGSMRQACHLTDNQVSD